MAAKYHTELSVLSPIGKKPKDVKPPPRTVVEVERPVCRDGWEQAMQAGFEGHMKTGTFSIVDRVPEGHKPVSPKWRFDYKTGREGNIVN